MNIAGPLEPTDDKHQIRISADFTSAVLATSSMAGWYRNLLDTAAAHPDLGSVVAAEPVDRLGAIKALAGRRALDDGSHDHHLHDC